jgi:hypothetical protein
MTARRYERIEIGQSWLGPMFINMNLSGVGPLSIGTASGLHVIAAEGLRVTAQTIISTLQI